MYDEILDYLQVKRKTVSLSTYNQIYCYIRLFYRYCIDNGKTLYSTSREDLESFLRSRKCNDETRKIILRTVGCFYEYLKWPLNPAKDIHLGRKRAHRLPPVPGATAVQNALQDTAGSTPPLALRNRALVELAYGSGLRVCELQALCIEDIDFYNRTVYVRGKGSRTRIVPITGTSADYLQKYINERKVHRGPLFVARHSGKRLKVQMIGKIFRVKTGIRAHLYRHACATHMLKNGCSIRIIQQLLGHIDLTTTQLYTHITKHELKNVINRFHPGEQYGLKN